MSIEMDMGMGVEMDVEMGVEMDVEAHLCSRQQALTSSVLLR